MNFFSVSAQPGLGQHNTWTQTCKFYVCCPACKKYKQVYKKCKINWPWNFWNDIMTLWHHDMKTWQHDKQSLLSLHMKTKVVQHVPRINIKHMTYDIMTSWHEDMTAWQTITFEPTHENYTLHASRVTLSIWHIWQHDHRSASQHDNRLA